MRNVFILVFFAFSLLMIHEVHNSYPLLHRFSGADTLNPDEAAAVEAELAAARAAIRKASAFKVNAIDHADGDFVPSTNIYRNPAAFFQSYHEMEKKFKVYVYEDGEKPLVHDGPVKDIYSVEGRFIQELEKMRPLPAAEGGLRTSEPSKAHAFFLPFSVVNLRTFFFKPNNYDRSPIRGFVADYVDAVASKYPFWNRTAGADHFMLACHDWGPEATSAKSELYSNSIRGLCNANTTEGFKPYKDVSIPELNLHPEGTPKQLLSPPKSANRPFLAFFAGGGNHGPVRPHLLKHWKDRDNKLQVHDYLPKGVNYYDFMLSSKFCLCPSGYEVASPRIAESVYSECIPVIMSEGYELPFSDVLRWEEFSVSVTVTEIPRLKEILDAIPEEEVERLREGVRAVRRHFEFNMPTKRFDAFHMIMHSVWLRRLNMRLGN